MSDNSYLIILPLSVFELAILSITFHHIRRGWKKTLLEIFRFMAVVLIASLLFVGVMVVDAYVDPFPPIMLLIILAPVVAGIIISLP